MAIATVISLKTRAYQVSHLCFPTPGIIEDLAQVTIADGRPNQFFSRPIQLGDRVTPFDFVKFYAGLREVPKADPSLLSYDSRGILNDPSVRGSLLMTLRAESTAALLDKAVSARQSTYYAKYANQGQIISVMTDLYKAASQAPSAKDNVSKPQALSFLSVIALQQASDLENAYNQGLMPSVPGLPNVVRGTSSELKTYGSTPDTTQIIGNTDYTYRTPLYEAAAQGWRAQISLIDQQFSAFMASQNLPKLEQVFSNELGATDLDVKRLQIAYLNSILMSPINGIITGIYKNSGDWVQAGEPVIRVEDNRSVILVGTLKYRGSISIGQQMTVTTSLFDSPNVLPIVGNVIAVRGRPNEDDRWDVHALCDNSSAPVLPLNYQFDYDDTSVVIN
jgi:hypothetical protein